MKRKIKNGETEYSVVARNRDDNLDVYRYSIAWKEVGSKTVFGLYEVTLFELIDEAGVPEISDIWISPAPASSAHRVNIERAALECYHKGR
jgi:predicted SPOUT superfamily RNA methylase MTH1